MKLSPRVSITTAQTIMKIAHKMSSNFSIVVVFGDRYSIIEVLSRFWNGMRNDKPSLSILAGRRGRYICIAGLEQF